MTFLHEQPDFSDLCRIVAEARGLPPGLVEKDYWVVHSLWALHQLELDIWFKGGTSLSKGFSLIERFSEDLDLKIGAGKRTDLPMVSNWTSTGKPATRSREAFYSALEGIISIPGASVRLDREKLEESAARAANFEVTYQGHFLDTLGPMIKPFVLLEVGMARVTPFVERPVRAFVQDWVAAHSPEVEFEPNWPVAVRCIHPWVTLLEKLDAITRRYDRCVEPAGYIRHYGDAARIIQHAGQLPQLTVTLQQLMNEMVDLKELAGRPDTESNAWSLPDATRRAELQTAHAAIGPMFWGPRIELLDACAIVRGWIAELAPEDSI